MGANLYERNMTELIYKELSYKIVGILYEVFNHLGYGHREVYYHRAISRELSKAGISFEHEKEIPLYYKGEKLGKTFVDFLIESKIVLEIKVVNLLKKKDFEQIISYIKSAEIKLGIIALFTKQGVRYRRLVNTY